VTAPAARSVAVEGEQHRTVPGGPTVAWRFSTRADGDFAVDGDPVVLATRRRALVSGPWVWLHQVHGPDVVTVTAANAADVAGTDADALVTTDADIVLAVQTADCVPVILTGTPSVAGGPVVVAVAHAGWRGTCAGIVENTVARMRDLGASRIDAVIGPCIRPECYEFGPADLARLVDRFGPTVRATTSWNTAAADVARAVRLALDGLGVRWRDTGTCTACTPEHYFSHRARAETERQTAVVWIEAPTGVVLPGADPDPDRSGAP
jgi:polyphenol oxidase